MRLIALLVFLLSFTVHAKRFSNQYVEFELPPGWLCALEGSEWVCQSENADRKKEAIIILAAKIRGEQDSNVEYLKYLKQPKTYSLPGGRMQVSEARYTKKTNINNHAWVDSLHLASEVPGFYTRYLATVKEDLGVAVTFSVAKDKYNDYKAVFDAAVTSLRVFRQKSSKVSGGYQIGNTETNLGDTTFIPDGEIVDISASQTKKRKGKGPLGDDMTLYLIVGGVLLVLIFLKKLKK